MATALSRATDNARKAIIIFIIFAIFTFIAQFIGDLIKPGTVTGPVTGTSSGYKNADNLLGDIPAPKVNSITLAEGTKASFALANSGVLPVMPPTVNVYEIQEPRVSFGDEEIAAKAAARFGLTDADKRANLSANKLLWQNSSFSRTFTYTEIEHIYDFKASYTTDSSAQNRESLLTAAEYSQQAPNIISKVVGANTAFTGGKSRIDFINVSGQNTFTSADADKARYARIAVYKSIESTSIRQGYQPGANEKNPAVVVNSEVHKYNYLDAPIVAVVQGKLEKSETDFLSFDYREYFYGKSGVYPLISSEQAWNNIQANKGYLYWLKKQTDNTFSAQEKLNVLTFDVDTTKVRVIYMEPDAWVENEPWTHYVQPFYIFEGTAILQGGIRADFAFLTEAITYIPGVAQK